mgnify:CR=1 FL=1
MEETPQKWYIIKEETGTCEILSAEKIVNIEDTNTPQKWGPFNSINEAIASRVGLIRAGKCQPK